VSRSAYKGRALWTSPRQAPRRLKAGWVLLLALIAAGAAWTARDALAKTLPWRAVFTVRTVEVQGETYLSEAEVRTAAGLARPVDFARVDLAQAERKLMKQSRIERASVERELPRRIVIRIVERKPALIVRGGRLFETDRRGVILPPLSSGVTPDVPLVSGVRVKDARAGKRIADPAFARALRQLDALMAPEVALGHPVSEIDVSDANTTVVTLAPDGVDVLLPAEPQTLRMLSALRVVLADLANRGETASRIDLRGEEVIAVRPIPAAAAPADTADVQPHEARRG
jgi:cell division septal protein FtsQ